MKRGPDSAAIPAPGKARTGKEDAMDPTKVLFVLGTMEIGGVQSGVMNFARIAPPEEVRFDIAVFTGKEGYHEAEFRKYGNVYHIPLLETHNKYLSVLFTLPNDLIVRVKLKRFLKSHEPYDAVHTKLLKGTAPALEVAKKCGVPVRVAQSHVDRPDRLNPFDSWYYRWCAKRIEKSATVKLAVSEKAIDLLFAPYGARRIKNPTISLERLNPSLYQPEPHADIRLIQVGTYSRRKNQCFSVDVLKGLLDAGQDARLAFVGYPLDEPDYIRSVEDRIRQYGLTERVKFYPKDADVPLLLSQSDCMLIPSLREGLPNVALEAQAMGVPCFLSDAITKDTDCGLCVFLSLQDGPACWAEAITQYRRTHGREKKPADMSSWDQREVAKEYIRIWKGSA